MFHKLGPKNMLKLYKYLLLLKYKEILGYEYSKNVLFLFFILNISANFSADP